MSVRYFGLLALCAFGMIPVVASSQDRSNECRGEAQFVYDIARAHQAHPQASELTLVRAIAMANSVEADEGPPEKELALIKIADSAIYRVDRNPTAGPDGAKASYLADCLVAGPLMPQ